MKQSKSIETQLECRATAALKQSVSSDLEQEDKSLSELLKDKEQDTDDISRSR